MNVFVRLAVAVVLPTLVLAGMPTLGADEKPAAKEAKPAAAKEAKAGEKKSPADYRGPLPFYYAKVVSPDQKEKLYAITEKYAPQIKEAQTKLKELQEAMIKEIDASMTPEQLARIKELREEAAKGKTPQKTPAQPVSKTEGEKKPAEKKSE